MLERIKERGREVGLSSLTKIEAASGIKPGTIYRWDDNFPSVDRVAAVASTLGVTMDYLFGLTDKKEPEADTGDGFCEDEQELIRLFRAAGPETRAAMLHLLRVAEAARSVQGGGEADR